MLLAKDQEGKRIHAKPHTTASCIHCGEKMISKCGDIKIWHWAHVTKCKYQTEPETEWHREWKQRALDQGLEIEHHFLRHITDAINLSEKICYEFQHSQIERVEMISRAFEYKKKGYQTNWIFDYSNKYSTGELIVKIKDNKKKRISFKQKRNRKIITQTFYEGSKKNGVLFFDLGDLIIHVIKIYENGNGWGYLVKKEEII